MQVLGAALDDAAARRPRVVMVVGEAGIGKTRVVDEFATRAGSGEDRVLWGRCPEHGGAPPFWPWVQALTRYIEGRDAVELRTTLGRSAADVATIVPALRGLLGIDVASDANRDGARFGLFDGVTGFLRRIADEVPLIVILDDLHWADEDSLALLDFIARDLRGAQLLVIGTYREIEMHRRPRLLGTIGHVSDRLALRGLAPADVARFVEATTSQEPPTPVIAALHESTEGNPFFLDEMIRVLGASGTLDLQRLADPGVVLPESVRDAIRRRFEPLSADERAVLDVAATLGREFDLSPLRTACELEPAALLERLAAPLTTRLVEEVPGDPGRYRFAHALVREVLYRDLMPARRAAMHLRVGRAIEALHAGSREAPLAELAHHFHQAASIGDAGKAVEYASRAGTEAVLLLAYEDGRIHYEQALSATAFEPPNELRRLELLLALGDATWRSGDNLKAREVFQRAARTARMLGRPEGLVRAALGYGRARPEDGVVDATLISLLEEALHALAGRDARLHVALLARLAMALYFSPDAERRGALSAQAVELARETGDPIALAAALRTQHSLMWGPGPVVERLAIADEALGLATASGHARLAADLQAWRILDLLELGDVIAAERELELYARAAEETRTPQRRWHATLMRGTLALLQGRFEDAARLSAAALALRQDGQDPNVAQLFATQMFLLHREVGSLRDIQPMLAGFARDFPTIRGWALALALAHHELGETERARGMLEQLASRDFEDLPRDGTYIQLLALAAELVAALRDTRRAAVLYPLLTPHEDRNVVLSVAAGSLGSAARHLGMLAAVLGRREDAERHFARALAMNTAMGARPFEAHTRAAWAELLLATGDGADRARAIELLDAARTIAEALGMEHLRRRLAALQAPPAVIAAEPAGGDGMSAPTAGTTPPDGAHVAVLRCDGEFWTIAFGREFLRLKDAKGLVYLQTLIRHAGTEMHVLDLVREAEPTSAAISIGETVQVGLRAADLGDAGVVLDAEARAAYKRRLVDLRSELEEAQDFNDRERAERAEREIDFLTAELSRAVGLGGRERRAASVAERARVNVSRTVGTVMKKIAVACPLLGQHLSATVRTGVFCSYTPDPRLPLRWEM